jgi:hypothetical protein
MGKRIDPQRRLSFDAQRFYIDLEAKVKARGLSMLRFSYEVGVNSATLSRMKNNGMGLDGVNLAALCKWSGLNAADYSIDWEKEEMARAIAYASASASPPICQ